uniref:Protein kinase domain-containing protein n=1 Tax=Panagrolaimus sp. ES5 TaxID=591445 RepID=A0AC34F0H0_9BILA
MCLRNPGQVKLIDYGNTARIEKKSGFCREGGLGTAMFAARDAMGKNRKQQHKRSDIESWFYSLINISKDSGLGWGIGNYDKILKAKNDAWKKIYRRKFLGGLPEKFLRLMDYIDSIRRTRPIVYKNYYDLLKEIAEESDPILIPCEELFYYPAIPRDENHEYRYFETRDHKIGIIKSGTKYYKKDETKNYKGGKCVIFECGQQGCRTFCLYVDETIFKEEAREGAIPSIAFTTDKVHEH